MSEITGLILSPTTGTTFKQEKDVNEFIRKKGLDPATHLVIPYLGGFAVVEVEKLSTEYFHFQARDGKQQPFKTEAEANMAIQEKELNPKRYRVVPRGSGYGLLDMESMLSDLNGSSTSLANSDKPKPKREYALVIFAAKYPGSPEPDQIMLHVLNCDTKITVEREKQVVVPLDTLNAANDATYNRWTHKEGEGRKVGQPVRRCSYRIIRPASEEEYRKFVKEGAIAIEAAMNAGAPPPLTAQTGSAA